MSDSYAGITVGAITVTPLSDGALSLDTAYMFPSVATDEWKSLAEYLTADGKVPINLGAFLVSEDNLLTLVDTGAGGQSGSPGGQLLARLAEAGVQPRQITRVIHTHLHSDHVGWNTRAVGAGREIVFANARHVVQQADWEHFSASTARAANPCVDSCVDPVRSAGLLDVIDGDMALSRGISVLRTPGHTPGHQSVLIESHGERAIILGDVAHTPAQLRHTSWSPVLDEAPDAAAATRASVVDLIETQTMRVAAGHFPYPGIGRLIRIDGERRWQVLGL